MESHGSRLGSGRALFHCRISNPEGKHILTAMQDGLIRFMSGGKASKEETEEFEGIQNQWRVKWKL